MDGIVVIDKEKGYTSHDVVAIVKRTLHTKAGHTGTLDPEAEGVLPVLLGQATKLSDLFMAADKEYVAEICLGKTTSTQDATGEVLCEKPVGDMTVQQIQEALKAFEGNISQIPPMVSALKVNGKKLYELAREGKEIARKPRDITIFAITLVRVTSQTSFIISVSCSKGTYIRALAADIGEKLGCGAHMGSLCRMRTGLFLRENSIRLDKLKELAATGDIEKVILSMEDVLSYPRVVVKETAAKLLYNGNRLYKHHLQAEPESLAAGQLVKVYDFTDTLIGLYRYEWDDEKQQNCLKVDKFLKG